MNTLASFLGDSVRSFFRRSEVRRAVQEITKSSSQFTPKVQLIGTDGVFNERIQIEAAYEGKQLFYASSGTNNSSQTIEAVYNVTKVGIYTFLQDGQTPGISEVAITATEVVSTNYTDDSFYLNVPLPLISFSPEVKYLGYPSVNVDFNISYYNIFDGVFPKIQGAGLEYIKNVNLNVETLALENDLSEFAPSKVVIDSFYLYLNHNDAVNTIVLPHCTFLHLDMNSWQSNFSVDTVDLSGTKFIYNSLLMSDEGSLDILPKVTNLLFAPVEEIKEMPFYISFGYSPDINQDDIDTLLEILVAMDGTNGTTLWAGDLWMAELPAPSEAAITNIGVLVGRGATVTYTQP